MAFLLCFFISPGKHVRHMVTLHTKALQARKAMWTTWHHAVNPESSTEAASIQRVLETKLSICRPEKSEKKTQERPRTSFEVNLSGMPFLKMDVDGSLNRCAAGMDEKCICEAFPEIGCKVCDDCTSCAHAGGEARGSGGTRGSELASDHILT